MFQRVVAYLLFLGVVFGDSAKAHAHAFVNALGFEIGGMTARLDPEQYNDLFNAFDIQGMDHLSGVTAGVTQDLNPNVRLAVRSGYLRESTGTTQIYVGPPPGPVPFNTELKFVAETIPVSIGVDFRLVNKNTALTASLAGEIHFLTLTESLEEQPSANFPGYEQSSQAVVLGLSGGIGVEWQASHLVVVGLRGGYRTGSADLSFPGSSDFTAEFDVSGAFGACYVIIQPWRRAS